ncbi:MAG: SPFH domain-containing protein [Planctomycetes bacterium]|nr:SPFH domain-containing protein [Planctomycetota bacterium]
MFAYFLEAEFDPTLPALGAVLGGLLLLVLVIILTRWKRVGPNEAAVISGKGKFRIITGGGTFVWPVLEMVQYLNLEIMTIDIQLKDIYTAAGVPVSVDGVAQLKVRGEEGSIRTAAERFLGKRTEQIRQIALQTLEGHLRAIVGKMSVEEIYRDRDRFAQEVQLVAADDMAGMGLMINSFALRDIKDDEGYLEALGKPQIAKVKRDATIAEADMSRDARIRKADAEKDAKVKEAEAFRAGEQARYTAETEIAMSKRDYEMKQAEYDQATALKKAEADLSYDLQTHRSMQAVKEQEMQVQIVEREKQIEIQEREIRRREKELEASVNRPAEAERYKIQQMAEAERFKREQEATGQANADRALGEGEAAANKARGLAKADVERAEGLAKADVILAQGANEAEAMAKKALAWRQYNEAAILEMLIAKLPEIAREVAAPLSNIGNITLVSTGGENGSDGMASRISGEVTKVLAQLPPTVQALSGVDLLDLFKKLPALAKSGDANATREARDALDKIKSGADVLEE